MAQASAQFGFIDPRRIVVLRYGDFAGPNAANPLNLVIADAATRKDKDLAHQYLLRGCLIVFFTQNSRYTLQAVEVLSSFNVQESGLGIKFGYVNLTEDDRIVNDLINNENTRTIEGGIYRNLFPPYFLVYVDGVLKGFINFNVFSVGGITETLRSRPNLCLQGIPIGERGTETVNKMIVSPEQDLGFRPSPTSKPILFNLNTRAGSQGYVKQLTEQSRAAREKFEAQQRARERIKETSALEEAGRKLQISNIA